MAASLVLLVVLGPAACTAQVAAAAVLLRAAPASLVTLPSSVPLLELLCRGVVQTRR
jgi:hypothetical protein